VIGVCRKLFAGLKFSSTDPLGAVLHLCWSRVPPERQVASERRLAYLGGMSRFVDLASALVLFTLSIAACDANPKSDDESNPKSDDKSDASQPDAKSGEATKPVEKAKPPEPTGIALTLTVNGKPTTLELSKSILAARPPESKMASWVCELVTGTVLIVDFTIGDDPARVGELFVGGVERTEFRRTEAGVAVPARIQYRNAGEPTPKYAPGTMTWAEDLLSGTAEGKGENGDVVTATWTCSTAP
jgi:hypothetical protein